MKIETRICFILFYIIFSVRNFLEYIDCVTGEGYDNHERPRYDIQQFDGEAQVL